MSYAYAIAPKPGEPPSSLMPADQNPASPACHLGTLLRTHGGLPPMAFGRYPTSRLIMTFMVSGAKANKIDGIHVPDLEVDMIRTGDAELLS